MRALIIGTGAQAKYVLECWSLDANHDPIGLVTDPGAEVPAWVDAYGCAVLGTLDRLGEIVTGTAAEGYIACAPSPRRRRALNEHGAAHGLINLNAHHPSAILASTAAIADGTLINPGAVVQPFARIDCGAIIHANAVIEHDCLVEEYANIAPGVSLAGWVRIGESTTVYTGANVAPGVRIGRNATVAAGSVVLTDVADGGFVAGVPATSRRRRV